MQPVQPPIADQPLRITLGADEALVLFELLARYEHDGRLAVGDPAEEVVLTRLLGHLERHLVAPLDARYTALLAAARARVGGPRADTSAPAS